MPEDRTVKLLKSGNRLVVSPTTRRILNILEPELCFTSTRHLFGAERFEEHSRIKLETYQCYVMDHRDRIATSLGFYRRIERLLKLHGYESKLVELSKRENPEDFVPRWDRIFKLDSRIKLRYGQEEFLIKFASLLSAGLPGRFDCPPGYGKSYLVGIIGLLYPKLRIHVASKRVAVLRDRILPELRGMLPDVGMVGGGLRRAGCRVQLFTFDSLHHSDGKADILIVDESHESAADVSAEELARYDCSVNFGFSATHDMRLDNKNLREEAMFGPIVYKIPYQEAVRHGLVVPIEVIWRDVIMDSDPCEGADDLVEKKRLGIWRNNIRNTIIADDARSYLDKQVLIPCETIEHALALKKKLPEYTIVHAAKDISHNDKQYFRREKLWPKKGLKQMTDERKHKLTRLFERGKLRKVIVTTVWNVGVSMNHLEVICRADAGGSPIMDTQIPGRGSRTNKKIAKTKAIIRDYKDQFNSGFKTKASKRFKNYEAHGWKQTSTIADHEDQAPPKRGGNRVVTSKKN